MPAARSGGSGRWAGLAIASPPPSPARRIRGSAPRPSTLPLWGSLAYGTVVCESGLARNGTRGADRAEWSRRFLVPSGGGGQREGKSLVAATRSRGCFLRARRRPESTHVGNRKRPENGRSFFRDSSFARDAIRTFNPDGNDRY